MKKHDEGYALVLVLVVMVVLCLVALSMMSVSLHNMERQRASIQRMQDQYMAEGAIEAVLAEFDNIHVVTIETSEEIGFEDALTSRLDGYCQSVSEEAKCEIEIVGMPEYKSGDRQEEIEFSFTLMATSGEAQITCDILLTATLGDDHPEYILSNSKLTYQSYTISTITEGGEAA